MTQPKSRLAKLTPPTLPVVLTRARLFRVLDRARTRPLTWIAAPAGFGKTTLVASYLKARRRPVCWYRLDEGDADPATFFHYLSLAAKSLVPKIRRPLPVLTPEYALGLPTFTRRFFQELCARLPRRCVLVLDNYQEVPSTSALHQLLPYAIQELPEHVSVLVMSRQDPPPPLVTVQCDRGMTVIGADSLTLSRVEAKAIVQLHWKKKADGAMRTFVDEAYRRVGGWAAGLMLMVEQAKGDRRVSGSGLDGTSETIFRYLAGEVMERLSPDVRQLLLKTSVLSDINIRSAEVLTGLSNAGDLLAFLHRSRYFTERRQGTEPSYRYHPLFRDFLLHRARVDLGTAQIQALQRNAADLLIKEGRIEEAVLVLQAAEDWEGLVQVILGQAQELVATGRIQTLEAWILCIPEPVRAQSPWLMFWLASTKVSFDPDQAYALFDQSLDEFLRQGDRTGALLSWCGAIRAVLIRWDGLGRITKLLELFPTIHPDGASYPSIEVEAHVADCLAGAIMQTRPDRDDARAWLDRAVSLSDHLPPAVQTGSRYMTEIYFLWFGDIAAARAGLEQFSRLRESKQWNLITAIFFHATTATLAWFDSELDLCRLHIGKARELVTQSGLHVWDGLIISQGVAGELLAGNLSAAEALLKEEDAMTQRLGGIHRAHYLHLFAWFLRLRGDHQKALEEGLRSNDLIAAAGGHLFGQGINALVIAHALHELGQLDGAARYVEQSLEIGDRMRSDLLRFGAWVLTAKMAFDRNDAPAGLVALKKALTIGEVRGLMQYPSCDRRLMAGLCARALIARIHVPFVLRMIQKHRFAAPLEARCLETWPWPIKIYTLGRFEVLINGQPLGKNRKTPHRLMELLIAIMTYGGAPVSAARLMDMLWPEADGDQARENLKKSIARLRQLLAVDDALCWQDGEISLNRTCCWVDAWAFEACASTVEVRGVTGNASHDDQDDPKAIALYRGPFLGWSEIPSWASSYQDQVRKQFIRLVTKHAHVPTDDQREKLMTELANAIDLDPVAEPLYQKLIPLLLSANRHAEAAACYDRCRTELARWAGRSVSVDLQKLAQTLRPR